MKFDLHRMQLLRELARRGTVTSVAAALSYSPSAVSQQLAALEQEVGTPLLEPDGRGVRLNRQAEILVEHTSVVLEQLECAKSEILASLRSVGGTVRLATIQTAALALVSEMLTSLADEYPGLRVQVTQAEPDVALPGLTARQFDLVCDENYPEFPARRSPDMSYKVIGDDPMRVAFRDPPEEHGPRRCELAQFAQSPWVMEPVGSPGREWTVIACRRAGFEPKVEHETSDMLVQAALVARGHAVAFLPDLMWFDRAPTFHLRQMSRTHVRQIVTTCRTGSDGNPALVAVRRALRDAYERGRPQVTDR